MYDIVQQNLKLWLYFVIQRYKIHLRKDIQKQQRPWTNDPILHLYSFTNVRRIQDTVTKYILKKVCLNPDLSLRQKILNLLWFRIFNKPQTFELFNFPIRQQDLNCSFQQVAQRYSMLVSDPRLSRGAYMNSGPMKRYTQYQKQFPTYMMPFHMIWQFNRSKEIQDILKGQPQPAFDALLNIRGMGEFLAYQVYVDLCYCPQTTFTQNDFVYLGQGAKAGVQHICPNLNHVEKRNFIKYVQENIDFWLDKYYNTSLFQLMEDLHPDERYISLSNLQNCMCQFSKYMRYLNNKPARIRYYGKNKNVII